MCRLMRFIFLPFLISIHCVIKRILKKYLFFFCNIYNNHYFMSFKLFNILKKNIITDGYAHIII